jgi:hypothetical protein
MLVPRFQFFRDWIMTKTDVLVRLRELHEKLSAINEDLKDSNDVDEATIEALGQLVSDISVAVDSAKSESGNGADAWSPNTLQERVLNIESQHPRITGFLSELSDLLGMLGI